MENSSGKLCCAGGWTISGGAPIWPECDALDTCGSKSGYSNRRCKCHREALPCTLPCKVCKGECSNNDVESKGKSSKSSSKSSSSRKSDSKSGHSHTNSKSDSGKHRGSKDASIATFLDQERKTGSSSKDSKFVRKTQGHSDSVEHLAVRNKTRFHLPNKQVPLRNHTGHHESLDQKPLRNATHLPRHLHSNSSLSRKDLNKTLGYEKPHHNVTHSNKDGLRGSNHTLGSQFGRANSSSVNPANGTVHTHRNRGMPTNSSITIGLLSGKGNSSSPNPSNGTIHTHGNRGKPMNSSITAGLHSGKENSSYSHSNSSSGPILSHGDPGGKLQNSSTLATLSGMNNTNSRTNLTGSVNPLNHPPYGWKINPPNYLPSAPEITQNQGSVQNKSLPFPNKILVNTDRNKLTNPVISMMNSGLSRNPYPPPVSAYPGIGWNIGPYPVNNNGQSRPVASHYFAPSAPQPEQGFYPPQYNNPQSYHYGNIYSKAYHVSSYVTKKKKKDKKKKHKFDLSLEDHSMEDISDNFKDIGGKDKDSVKLSSDPKIVTRLYSLFFPRLGQTFSLNDFSNKANLPNFSNKSHTGYYNKSNAPKIFAGLGSDLDDDFILRRKRDMSPNTKKLADQINTFLMNERDCNATDLDAKRKKREVGGLIIPQSNETSKNKQEDEIKYFELGNAEAIVEGNSSILLYSSDMLPDNISENVKGRSIPMKEASPTQAGNSVVINSNKEHISSRNIENLSEVSTSKNEVKQHRSSRRPDENNPPEQRGNTEMMGAKSIFPFKQLSSIRTSTESLHRTTRTSFHPSETLSLREEISDSSLNKEKYFMEYPGNIRLSSMTTKPDSNNHKPFSYTQDYGTTNTNRHFYTFVPDRSMMTQLPHEESQENHHKGSKLSEESSDVYELGSFDSFDRKNDDFFSPTSETSDAFARHSTEKREHSGDNSKTSSATVARNSSTEEESSATEHGPVKFSSLRIHQVLTKIGFALTPDFVATKRSNSASEGPSESPVLIAAPRISLNCPKGYRQLRGRCRAVWGW